MPLISLIVSFQGIKLVVRRTRIMVPC